MGRQVGKVVESGVEHPLHDHLPDTVESGEEKPKYTEHCPTNLRKFQKYDHRVVSQLLSPINVQ